MEFFPQMWNNYVDDKKMSAEVNTTKNLFAINFKYINIILKNTLKLVL